MTMNVSDYQNSLIGTGLKCPGTFNQSNGRVNVSSGTDKINQSIRHILSTRVGERFFLPEFGSRLHELIFEPNDYILEDMLIYYVKDALTKWEPRVKILQVVPQIIEYRNTVPINISYNLINTNIITNYVYPFNREIYELGDMENNYEESSI